MAEFTLSCLNGIGVEIASRGALPVYRVKNSRASLEVSPYGAHILSYVPAGEKDLLWLSEKAWFEEGKPVRGGIPVCWPWFGPAAQPAHGIARISNWELEEARAEADGSTTLVFSLDRTREYGLRARFSVNAGDALKVSLTTFNVGTKPYDLSEALHSYFSISEIGKVSVSGIDPGNKASDCRNGTLVFRSETDWQVLPQKGILVIDDPGYGRKIRIERTGSESAVIWNPWVEKSKRMVDFGDEEYHTMLCVEAANVKTDARTLLPGAWHTLGTRISLLK